MVLQNFPDFITWQKERVIQPCVEWLNEKLARWAPLSITLFGSHSYYLPMPSSDFDVAVVLEAGWSTKEFLKYLEAQAKDCKAFTHTRLWIMKTFQPKCKCLGRHQACEAQPVCRWHVPELGPHEVVDRFQTGDR